MMKRATMMERIGTYILAICVGSMIGLWGCWVSANDEHILTVGECMVKVANERNISTQEAFIICEREQK